MNISKTREFKSLLYQFTKNKKDLLCHYQICQFTHFKDLLSSSSGKTNFNKNLFQNINPFHIKNEKFDRKKWDLFFYNY